MKLQCALAESVTLLCRFSSLEEERKKSTASRRGQGAGADVQVAGAADQTRCRRPYKDQCAAGQDKEPPGVQGAGKVLVPATQGEGCRLPEDQVLPVGGERRWWCFRSSRQGAGGGVEPSTVKVVRSGRRRRWSAAAHPRRKKTVVAAAASSVQEPGVVGQDVRTGLLSYRLRRCHHFEV